MKTQNIEIKIPVNYTKNDLKKMVIKNSKCKVNNFIIVKKSLDARKKNNLVWNIKIDINTEKRDFESISDSVLGIKREKRDEHIIVVGSGPAGIFSGLVLLKAGYRVTLLERGPKVDKRDKDIYELTENGIFNKNSNYAFGEGGAGTYSDGKLTSRSKHINKERDFILSTFIKHGAPEEIFSLTHPHVGSDNLKIVCKNIRNEFYNLGGEILFNTSFISYKKTDDKVVSVESTKGVHDCNYLIMATGHSSFTTYKELIRKGVSFRTKNFALGFRAEHPQALINRSQWGCEKIDGIKAAEYRLTSKSSDTSVYSFCMCPGGVIVPAAALERTSIVNGMSYYNRDGEFANAAVVASFNYSKELARDVDPLEALESLSTLEESYYSATGSYRVPGMRISDFINSKDAGSVTKSSYSLGVEPYDLATLLPKTVIEPLREGLKNFSRKLKGYDTGNILGLESKTSSPIQVLRERSGLCSGFDNLYFLGEGSGWAGGIISSAADGIRGALDIIKRES